MTTEIDYSPLEIVGPTLDDDGHERRYIANMLGNSLGFSVINDTQDSWSVRIDGVPGPGIVHEEPWKTADCAYQAALRAVHAILDLEHVQAVDQGLAAPD